MDERRVVTELLFELGISRRYKGYEYVYQSILAVMKDTSLLNYISKGLYGTIAVRNDVPVNSVERDIRTIKEIVWRNHKEKPLFRYCTELPTNGYFIDLLTYDVQKRMLMFEEAGKM